MNKINEEICEIIGAFIGDGYMGIYRKQKDKYQVGFVGDQILDEDYLITILCH